MFRDEPTLHGNSCLEPERSDTPADGRATCMVWWYLPYTGKHESGLTLPKHHIDGVEGLSFP